MTAVVLDLTPRPDLPVSGPAGARADLVRALAADNADEDRGGRYDRRCTCQCTCGALAAH